MRFGGNGIGQHLLLEDLCAATETFDAVLYHAYHVRRYLVA
jgi:hypothetical protein